MNKRLEQFLSAENISQAQFADTIEVARASVSHVIAGRNKPGYDFIKSISEHYPKLSLDWLINGKGKMYREQPGHSAPPQEQASAKESYSDELFGPEEPEIHDTHEGLPANSASSTESKSSYQDTKVIKNQRAITKVVIFFDDNTYQELV